MTVKLNALDCTSEATNLENENEWQKPSLYVTARIVKTDVVLVTYLRVMKKIREPPTTQLPRLFPIPQVRLVRRNNFE